MSELLALDLSSGSVSGKKAMDRFYQALAFPLQGVCRYHILLLVEMGKISQGSEAYRGDMVGL